MYNYNSCNYNLKNKQEFKNLKSGENSVRIAERKGRKRIMEIQHMTMKTDHKEAFNVL